MTPAIFVKFVSKYGSCIVKKLLVPKKVFFRSWFRIFKIETQENIF